ncbi:hypothetical protein Tco_0641997 [Tanacetum coccineum]
MAVPNGGNQIARRVIDDLIEFSGQALVDGYMSFFKSQQITETCGFINRLREEANTSRNLIDQLNVLIAEMESLDDQGEMFDTLMDPRDDREAANTKLQGCSMVMIAVMDKMKLWFIQAQTEEHSFSMVIRDFYFELRVTLSQNQRLIAELEALGQRGDALKALKGLREML